MLLLLLLLLLLLPLPKGALSAALAPNGALSAELAPNWPCPEVDGTSGTGTNTAWSCPFLPWNSDTYDAVGMRFAFPPA